MLYDSTWSILYRCDLLCPVVTFIHLDEHSKSWRCAHSLYSSQWCKSVLLYINFSCISFFLLAPLPFHFHIMWKFPNSRVFQSAEPGTFCLLVKVQEFFTILINEIFLYVWNQKVAKSVWRCCCGLVGNFGLLYLEGVKSDLGGSILNHLIVDGVWSRWPEIWFLHTRKKVGWDDAKCSHLLTRECATCMLPRDVHCEMWIIIWKNFQVTSITIIIVGTLDGHCRRESSWSFCNRMFLAEQSK